MDSNPQPKITFPLLRWFEQHGRKNLPWQKCISPYRVWLSEIMLQQTQVTTVIPYFEKFISRFKTVEQLANAPLDEVLHLWTGLGYYARARNLHRTAHLITTEYNGIFPAKIEQLMSFPGIGRSTAGAILSIAFEQGSAILDGNVKRVLCRYHGISEVTTKVIERLWQLAEQHTPKKHCRHYTQAIMDLGATVCTHSKPRCDVCPLIKNCLAYRQGNPTEFPKPNKKAKLPVKATRFLVIRHQNKILLERRPLIGLWGGLWSFPECPVDDDIATYCQNALQIAISPPKEGKLFRHTFTHFHLDITPIFAEANQMSDMVAEHDTIGWWPPSSLPKIGLSAPVVKLLTQQFPVNVI